MFAIAGLERKGAAGKVPRRLRTTRACALRVHDRRRYPGGCRLL